MSSAWVTRFPKLWTKQGAGWEPIRWDPNNASEQPMDRAEIERSARVLCNGTARPAIKASSGRGTNVGQ